MPKRDDMITICVGADICPIERNLPLFLAGDVTGVFNDLLLEFEESDLCIANLECPVIEAPSPIRKSGPVFGVDGACIDVIKRAGIDVLGLANNHILDHGVAGLENTLRVCRAARVETVGAGNTLETAGKILVREVQGLRIGILAMAEHEYSIATRNRGGANPLDLAAFARAVRAHRRGFDYLVVLFHGGHEHYPLPSPRVKDTCRFMVEMGANAVFVQHPHRLCGHEEYLGAHIIYGQGALILDERIFRDLKPFHEGLLVKLRIGEDLSTEIEFIPFSQADPDPGARRMDAVRSAEVLRAFEETSQALRNDELLLQEWSNFCDGQRNSYLSSLLGHGRVLDRLNRRGLITRLLYRRKAVIGALHVTSCETHREILETVFRDLLESQNADQA